MSELPVITWDNLHNESGVPAWAFVNDLDAISDADLGALVRSQLALLRPGEWANLTMGHCLIQVPEQSLEPNAPLVTISRS